MICDICDSISDDDLTKHLSGMKEPSRCVELCICVIFSMVGRSTEVNMLTRFLYICVLDYIKKFHT